MDVRNHSVNDADTQPLIDSPATTTSTRWKILQAGIGLGGCAGVVLSSTLLNSVFSNYIHACSDVINTFSPALITCRAPFSTEMAAWESVLVVSTFVLGYLGQKSWELTPTQKKQVINKSAPIENRTFWDKASYKVKYAIGYLQASYGYEVSIALGYLYNGLWLPGPLTIPQWMAYYRCQASSIGLGGAFLGMYLRIQQYNLKQAYSLILPKDISLKIRDHWKEYLISGLALGYFTSTFFWSSSQYKNAIEFINSVSVILITRPLGSFFSRFIESHKKESPTNLKEKTISALSAGLFLQSPLVVGGYFAYLKTIDLTGVAHTIVKSLSLGLIGVAMGIKDARFISFDYDKAKAGVKPSDETSLPLKIAHLVKNYWQTAALAAATATLMVPSILKCPSIKMYVCPFSFELGGNYINFDGRGLSSVLIAGLTTFYAREVFKAMHQSSYTPLQKTGRFFLNVMDKYQFDLISLIPLAVFTAGEYIQAYSAYASYNPYLTLILLGITFGTYKEQIKSRTGTQVLPGFVNVGVMINPV